MKYANNIIELVGNTPLVKLHKVTAGLRPTVLAKMEQLNPGGSVKDRIGLAMIEDAEKRGLLRPGGTIIEPTSGNTGHGLAMVAALRGYRMIFVMPDKMSAEKISLLRAYGAEVVVCPTNVERESPRSYYSVADQLTREIRGAFQPNQYFNAKNPEAHYQTTGPEIWQQTEGKVDVFVAGIGTGGTISGVGKYLREQNPSLQIVGADPEGSIYSGAIAPYKVEGVGEDFWPGTFNRETVDRIIQVTDRQAFEAARSLARQEGILVGGSAGMALHAALQVAKERNDDSVIVVLFPDTGRNYLSKFFNDEWMRQSGFLDRAVAGKVSEVLAKQRSNDGAGLVTVSALDTVGQAIDMMQNFGFSQLPVVDEQRGEVVGSLSERNLLDRVYRDPTIVSREVSAAMDPPFAEIALDSPIDEAFEPLLRGDAAVTVIDNHKPVGLITRVDLLEYVAHRRGTSFG